MKKINKIYIFFKNRHSTYMHTYNRILTHSTIQGIGDGLVYTKILLEVICGWYVAIFYMNIYNYFYLFTNGIL